MCDRFGDSDLLREGDLDLRLLLDGDLDFDRDRRRLSLVGFTTLISTELLRLLDRRLR